MSIFANSEDPDEKQHNAEFHLTEPTLLVKEFFP